MRVLNHPFPLFALLISGLLLAWLAPSAQAQTEFDCTAVTQIPQTECEALAVFYSATNGTDWLVNDGWLQTDTPCDWYGIVCDGGQNVTRIFLEANGLSGSIPPEIDQLPALSWLQLNSNQLTGPIPAELGNLSLITWLRLEDNQLTGPIPAELGQISRLENLYLSGNRLGGEIPAELGQLTNLQKLYLDEAGLTGTIPAELGALPNLSALILSSNPLLSGPIPSSFSQLDSLDFLHTLGTNLCNPADPEMQAWLAEIPDLYSDEQTCAAGTDPVENTADSATVESGDRSAALRQMGIILAALLAVLSGGLLTGWRLGLSFK